MTTDDNKDVSEQTTETTEEIETKEPVEQPKTNEELFNEMYEKFNNKVDEIIKSHKSEVDQLKEQISQKDQEIEKLKVVNRNIIMSTDVSKGSKEITDFSQVDFDEVDWSKETKAYFDSIDNKVF